MKITSIKFILTLSVVLISTIIIYGCTPQYSRQYEHCRNVSFKLNSYINCGNITDFVEYSLDQCKLGRDEEYGKIYGSLNTCEAADLFRKNNAMKEIKK